jgi:predicted kinase
MANKNNNPDSSLKLILVSGLPGSGKTYFSRAFSNWTGITRYSSDEVRLTLGLSGNYSKEAKQQVYNRLLILARQELRAGKSVIIDANFTHSFQREHFKTLAGEFEARYCPILLKADEITSLDRLSVLRPYSEADEHVYRKLIKESDYNEDSALCIKSTNNNLEDMIAKASNYIANGPF